MKEGKIGNVFGHVECHIYLFFASFSSLAMLLINNFNGIFDLHYSMGTLVNTSICPFAQNRAIDFVLTGKSGLSGSGRAKCTSPGFARWTNINWC